MSALCSECACRDGSRSFCGLAQVHTGLSRMSARMHAKDRASHSNVHCCQQNQLLCYTFLQGSGVFRFGGNVLHRPNVILIPVAPGVLGATPKENLVRSEMLQHMGLGPNMERLGPPFLRSQTISPQNMQSFQGLQEFIHGLTADIRARLQQNTNRCSPPCLRRGRPSAQGARRCEHGAGEAQRIGEEDGQRLHTCDGGPR